MTILQTLLDVGIVTSDAITFQNKYGNVDEVVFCNGLESIARLKATKAKIVGIPPSTEPWRGIFEEMLKSPDYDLALQNWVTTSTEDNLVKMAAIGAIAVREAAIRDAIDNSKSNARKPSEYIRLLYQLGYSFAFNDVTHNVEVNGREIDDTVAGNIRYIARENGIRDDKALEDAYNHDADEHRYNPIKDYFSTLQWDGQDHLADLAGYFTDELGMFGTWIRRWCVGAIARVMEDCQNRMLVIDGPQGIGKSYFVAWLASVIGKQYIATELAINPEDKDSRMRRKHVWIWEVSELGASLRRTDREALKSFISATSLRDRRPFGHHDTVARAISNFVGTVNNESGLLNDPTGSRRFMISKISKIDFSYSKDIDVHQIWAQAYALYTAGEPWLLTDDERTISNQINEQYHVLDIVEETIKQWFEVDPAQTTWRLSTLDIMDVLKDPLLGNLHGNEYDTRKLSSALTHLGLGQPKQMKFKGANLRGYEGIQRRRIGP